MVDKCRDIIEGRGNGRGTVEPYSMQPATSLNLQIAREIGVIYLGPGGDTVSPTVSMSGSRHLSRIVRHFPHKGCRSAGYLMFAASLKTFTKFYLSNQCDIGRFTYLKLNLLRRLPENAKATTTDRDP